MGHLLSLVTCCNFLWAIGKRFLAIYFFACSFLYSILGCAQGSPDYSLAFYYGEKAPINQLKFYSNIVVEPSSHLDLRSLQTSDRKVFAYVSLGEVQSLHQYPTPINKNWVIAKNGEWQSLVMDQTNPAWQTFFLDKVIVPLWEKGYRGFFLDTLDSYRLASQDQRQMKKQQEGIIAIIHAIKAKYPEAQLILNRGFEIIPQIRPAVDGVVAESLFSSWDNKNKRYVKVSKEEREALLKELLLVKKMGIPVTVIDYLAPEAAEKAKMLAKKIADLGFNPWVTNGSLTKLYLFDFDILPRKILLLYKGKQNNAFAKMNNYLSRAVSMPLNYMGYTTVLQNISDQGLPKNLSAKEYAGIIIALDGLFLGKEQELYLWYRTQIQKKIPLVILNNLGFSLTPQKLKPFGLSIPDFIFPAHKVKMVYKSPLMGYEIPPVATEDNFVPLRLLQGKSLLKLEDETGAVFDVAAITPWGGYFLTNNYLIFVNGGTDNGDDRWTIDPFNFFKQALRLPDRPVPDATTENGTRLMIAQIDGDGFANKGQWYKGPFVAEIMRKEFLERYSIPTTVSIIEGELAPYGLYPALSSQLEAIAKQIFALPNVEIASHTFSHPFQWHKAEAYKGNKVNPFSLPIPNYRLNLRREVYGSVEYINNKLAPVGKKCKAFLWSGDGDAPEEALKYVYELGLANINPGTLITKYYSSMTDVSSLGLYEGPYFQVFAPIGNDNEAIALEDTFYSLIDILDSFKLTDKPRRLKAIDIYVHFFTLSQMAGVQALHKVYAWALAQPVMNIYVSDFFNIVSDFNDLVIAKKGEGWLFETNDSLRELRIPLSMGYPDLISSRNVIGYSLYNEDVYIHLGPGGEAYVSLTTKPASIPFLVESNVRVKRFVRKAQNIDFSLEGYLPPKFTLANMDKCSLWKTQGNKQEQLMHISEQNNQKRYEFKKGTSYDLSIRCE